MEIGAKSETCLARDVLEACEAKKLVFTKPTTFQGKQAEPCAPVDSPESLTCYINEPMTEALITMIIGKKPGWTPVTKTGLSYMTNISQSGAF
jgi:hypothetical protein